MSASSWLVTCGIITQLRCRAGPEIFLIRGSCTVSTGPNFAKSTSGHGTRPRPAPAAGAAAGAGPRAITPFTNACTSDVRMRFFGPLPRTFERSMPSSRANFRTEGLACGLAPEGSAGASIATGGGARDGAGAGAGASAFGAGAAAAGAGAAGRAAAAPPGPSRIRIGEPCATLSPILSRISFTLPAAGDGTSIVALSLSTVTSDCSTATASPGFTRISITSTLLKSPMSGTSTCCVPPPPAAGAAGGALAAGGGAAGALAGAAAGAVAAAGAAAALPASPASSTRIGLPSDTLSPILTRTSLTTPADGDGISIVALSDSSVISDCSGVTSSPGFTRISMTSTLLKSPMSGTNTSCLAPMVRSRRRRATDRAPSPFPLLDGYRIRLVGIDAVLPDRLRHHRGLHRAVVGERLQRGHRHPVAVDLEEVTQLLARVGPPEPVGAEHAIGLALRHERPDLVGERLDVVGRGDDRPLASFQASLDVRLPRLVRRMQHVPPVGIQTVAAQLGEARAAPDVGGHTPVLLEQLRARDHFAQDRARPHELHLLLALAAFLEEIHALQDPGLHVLVGG